MTGIHLENCGMIAIDEHLDLGLNEQMGQGDDSDSATCELQFDKWLGWQNKK